MAKTKSYIDRIEGYLMRPLMIDFVWGLTMYIEFVSNLKLSNDLAVAHYKEMLRSQEPTLYSVEGEQPILSNYDFKNTKNKPPEQTVAVLNLKGMMIAEGGLCTRSIDRLCNELDRSATSSYIKGVVLNTHSGGGEVTAAQRLANSIKEYKKSGKPIIQFINGVSASGAVFAGVLCDEIMGGGRTTSTGSIGVVASFNKRQLDYIKENVINVYAEGSEDKHEILKAMLMNDQDSVKKKFLNPTRQEFKRLVKANRTLLDTDEVDVLKGGMFKAPEAKKYGLIDSVGTMQDAIRRVNTLANNRTKLKNRQASAKRAMQAISV